MLSARETVVLDKTVALLAKRDGIDKVCPPVLHTSEMIRYLLLLRLKGYA